MKKVLLSMMTAAMFFASCTSDDATTIPENNGTTENNQEELVAIKLGTGSRVGTTVVESKAAVEEWNANQIGVFALDRNNVWDNTIEVNDKPVLLFNELGTVGSSETEEEKSQIAVEWAEGKTLYYPRYSTRTYSFYAYHPYVADENVAITNSNNRIEVTGTFTGTEDIMAGKAICITDEGYNAKYFRDKETADPPTPETPDLMFKHLTTRLIINVAPGHKYNPETCTINTLKMSVPTEYTMTLAVLRNEDYEPAITSWGSDTAEQEFAKEVALEAVDPDAEEKTYQKKERVADILAKPGAGSYDLILTLPGVNENIIAPVTLKEGTFEAGKAYTVTLTINGPQEIVVTASLTDWEYVEEEIGVEI